MGTVKKLEPFEKLSITDFLFLPYPHVPHLTPV